MSFRSVYPAHGWLIGYESLKKICPDEVAAVEALPFFEECGGWCHMAECYLDPAEYGHRLEDSGVPDSDIAKLVSQYEATGGRLVCAFNHKTSLKLSMRFVYSDERSPEPDPYDCDGCLFYVDGMVQMTPAGERLRNEVHEVHWVENY